MLPGYMWLAGAKNRASEFFANGGTSQQYPDLHLWLISALVPTACVCKRIGIWMGVGGHDRQPLPTKLKLGVSFELNKDWQWALIITVAEKNMECPEESAKRKQNKNIVYCLISQTNYCLIWLFRQPKEAPWVWT